MATRQHDLAHDGDNEDDAAGRLRSWEGAQRTLNDPVARERIEAALRRLDEDPQPPPMTAEEFLEKTARLVE
jgi:hypothetical protein